MELQPSDGEALFDLLDDGDGVIDADEFLHGCLRLRGNAKALDLLVLSRDVAAMCDHNAREIGSNREVMGKIREEIVMNRQAMQANRAAMHELRSLIEALPGRSGR